MMGLRDRLRRVRPASRAVLAIAVVGLSTIGSASSSSAAGLPAAVEAFTIEGTWGCTAGCSSGTWTLSGASGGGLQINGDNKSCLENEAELETTDLAVALSCKATVQGQIHRSCTFGACIEQGVVNFSIQDGSDPGYTITPIPVTLQGSTSNEQASLSGIETVSTGSEALALEAHDVYAGIPTLLWHGAGMVTPGACADATGVVTVGCARSVGTFSIQLTGVEID